MDLRELTEFLWFSFFSLSKGTIYVYQENPILIFPLNTVGSLIRQAVSPRSLRVKCLFWGGWAI